MPTGKVNKIPEDDFDDEVEGMEVINPHEQVQQHEQQAEEEEE